MGSTYNDNEVSGNHTVKVTNQPITIGDGVTSFGRFNAAQEVVTHKIWDRSYMGSMNIRDWDSVVDTNGVIHIVYIDNGSLGSLDGRGRVVNYINSNNLTPVPIYTATGSLHGISGLAMCLGTELLPWLHIVFADIGAGPDTIKYHARTISGSSSGTESITGISTENNWEPYLDISVGIGTDNHPAISFNSTHTISTGVFSTYGIKLFQRASSLGITYASSTWVGTNINSHATQHLKRRSQVVFVGPNPSLLTIPAILAEYNGTTDGLYLYNSTGALTATIATGQQRMFRKSATVAPNLKIGVMYKQYSSTASYSEIVVDTFGATVESTHTFSTALIPTDVYEPNFQLVYDSNSKAHVSMRYINETNADSQYYLTNSTGSWTRQLVDASADNYAGEYAATATPGRTAGSFVVAFKQASIVYYNKPIIIYHDNTTQATPQPRLVKASLNESTVREYKISTALTNAIASLPSTGSTIEILGGDYYLDSNVNVNASYSRIKGQGSSTNIKVNAAVAKISIGTSATTNVRFEQMKLTSINAIPYTTNAQDAPMLELVATNATNCFVKNVNFVGYGGDAADKDMKHTLADGHIVDNNISTTGVSGLGGI